ncbi:hypothetical protein HYS28_02300 [Candidatus Uhrbacteria bacterium]|nr:hypothetical protein [Candidatus Uhrbacteria bacterium]
MVVLLGAASSARAQSDDCYDAYAANTEICFDVQNACSDLCYYDNADPSCWDDCSAGFDPCMRQAQDILALCTDDDDDTDSGGCLSGRVAANGTCVPTWTATQSDGGRTSTSTTTGPSYADEEAKCQEAYDSCASACPEVTETYDSTIDPDFTCWNASQDAYGEVFDSLYHGCWETKFACESEIINRVDGEGNHPCWGGLDFVSPCYEEMNEKCDVPFDACMAPATAAGDAAYDACIAPYRSTETISYGQDAECIAACDVSMSACTSAIDVFDTPTLDVDETIDVFATPLSYDAPIPLDIPAYEWDHYEEARDALQRVDNDPELAALHDSAGEYDAALDDAVADAENAEEMKEILSALRQAPENVRDAAQAYKDFSEFAETWGDIREYKFSEYATVDAMSDAVDTLTTYLDARDEGATAADAAAKAVIDTYVSRGLTLIPVFAAADFLANTPDDLARFVGFQEKGWLRENVTGVVAKVSPSGVIETTTELMLHEGWGDIDNALRYGMQRVIDAEGVVHTTWQTAKFGAAVLGAGPVAAARAVSDVVDGVLTVGGGVVNWIGGWFTD